MSTEGESPSGAPAGIPPSVRAQLLATEHWGLLASRSTTQSEVLTRISMFLTFTSASVVSVALVGQATKFSEAFVMLAVIVLFIDVAMGLLTQIRVMNVAQEDLMYVTAMNRLRAAYVDLDPGVAPYLMAAYHDDQAGANRTYFFFGNRSALSHVAGSSMIFMIWPMRPSSPSCRLAVVALRGGDGGRSHRRSGGGAGLPGDLFGLWLPGVRRHLAQVHTGLPHAARG
jgi:hypothetical protein